MVLFRTTLLAFASAVAVSADYVIQPDTVPLPTRMAWCNSQTASCGPICLQTSVGPPQTNECDAETLQYGCVCSDGKQPNMTQYTMTLPYFTCTEWGNQCVKRCGNDNLCGNDCREKHPCGALDPPKGNATKTTSSVSATATASATASNQVFNGFGDGSSSNAGSGNGNGSGAGAVRFGDSFGLVVVAGGLFAGLALLA
ncbi:hypothetical protein N657DRAFT_562923 [Parathielavia appendiculata]|uniref:DUF7707 domain-containing protein n=1 Tax=Parathielavia appendiculata TaxID=2587402 RepID=A0AAN6UAX2_9PEZI|nr:hypothetical protein N657DRAFT_562923 [Parathielavia appendiculata]